MGGHDIEGPDKERATEVREHLANEHTLLSWVRTGVGLISLGGGVERAGAFVSADTGGADELSGLLGNGSGSREGHL